MTLNDLFQTDLCIYYQILGKKPIEKLKEELSFLEPYLMLPCVSRLSGISYFYEANDTKLKEMPIKRAYSKLDHSVSCAIMIYTYTKNRTQTILALLKDIGTPVFSNALDSRLEQEQGQVSCVRDIVTVIDQEKELQQLLFLDGIDYQRISLNRYPLIESEKTKLCANQLDDIFATNLFLLGTKDYRELNYLYKDLILCHNEDSDLEFGFQNEEAAARCYDWNECMNQTRNLKDEKIALSILGDIILYGLERHVYTKEDLYHKQEEDIIQKIKVAHAKTLRYYWYRYCNLEKVYTSLRKPDNNYYQVKLTSIKRAIDPLFIEVFEEMRLTEGNEEYKIHAFNSQNEEKNLYSYVPFVTIDPSDSVKKMLLKK